MIQSRGKESNGKMPYGSFLFRKMSDLPVMVHVITMVMLPFPTVSPELSCPWAWRTSLRRVIRATAWCSKGQEPTDSNYRKVRILNNQWYYIERGCLREQYILHQWLVYHVLEMQHGWTAYTIKSLPNQRSLICVHFPSQWTFTESFIKENTD